MIDIDNTSNFYFMLFFIAIIQKKIQISIATSKLIDLIAKEKLEKVQDFLNTFTLEDRRLILQGKDEVSLLLIDY